MGELCEVNFRLVRSRSSVPRARALLRARLGEWRAGQDAIETAELLLSELVTNAVRVAVPGDRMIGVRIECRERGAWLRLEVSDAGEGRPEVRWPGELETGGRGLLIVDALAFFGGGEGAAGRYREDDLGGGRDARCRSRSRSPSGAGGGRPRGDVMRVLWRMLRPRSALRSGPLFRGTLIQLIDRRPILISGAREPVVPVPVTPTGVDSARCAARRAWLVAWAGPDRSSLR
ncbi:ATP-binding protein [Streptomyces sp. NPDC048142]|uniref:ATP-binding protein n=1 Tax=Streptomyces sp. NPDC048142 TaxID=3365501 RepID=UPI00371ABD11